MSTKAVFLLGSKAQLLAEQAASHLDIFDEKAKLLRDLTHFVINRTA
jgi:hypothetical protein